MLLTDEQRKQVTIDRTTGSIAMGILIAATAIGGGLFFTRFIAMIPEVAAIVMGQIGFFVFFPGLLVCWIVSMIIKGQTAVLLEKHKVMHVAENIDKHFKEIDRMIKMLEGISEKQKETVSTLVKAKEEIKETTERVDVALSAIKQ